MPGRLDTGGEKRNVPWGSTKLLGPISVSYSLCSAYSPYRGKGGRGWVERGCKLNTKQVLEQNVLETKRQHSVR